MEEPGSFAIRGGLLDIAAPDRDQPVRCEFFGETLEQKRFFEQALAGRTDLLGRRTEEVGELVPPLQVVGAALEAKLVLLVLATAQLDVSVDALDLAAPGRRPWPWSWASAGSASA